MRVGLFLYSRRALGRQLGPILETCGRSEILRPVGVSLTSRHGRSDLSIDDVLRSAALSASDSCEVRVRMGTIGVAWVYGSRGHIPRLWGELSVSGAALDQLPEALDQLAVTCGAVYGVADLASVRQAAMRSNPDWYVRENSILALHSLHWYNFFGAELAERLGRDPGAAEALASAGASARENGSGGLRVLLGPRPRVEAAQLRDVTRFWPFFREHDAGALFHPEVLVDYSEVWDCVGPDVRPRSVAELMGPADAFIASVPANALRFLEWSRGKGESCETEDDFKGLLSRHVVEIRDELLLPAVAAYGELVRKVVDGTWKKGRILHRGEPVVVRRGRPWSVRRVAAETLEMLDLSE